MTRRTKLQVAGGLALTALVVWGAAAGLERLMTPAAERGTGTPAGDGPQAGVPRITATLYYGTDDGQALVPVRREVALAEGVVPLGREILVAQLGEAPAPYVSVIPSGTSLRAFYVTERGDAFIDLSPDVSSNHPGGSFAELLTVYALVNAVTSNLPTVQRVQILIDGKEPDTLAGHVDLRRPLQKDLALVRESP